MAAHAKFSPSGAHRWMPCPGSMALEADYPNESSEYADEGTAAHTILSECLLEQKDAAEHIGRVVVVKQEDDEGNVTSERAFTVDEDMAGHIQATLDSVRRRAVNKVLLVEQRVEFTKNIGTVDPQFGTSDIIMISADGDEVDVEDFKYGMGVKVYASEIVGHAEVIDAETGEAKQAPIFRGNKQMLSYALGVLETFGGLLGDFKKFNLRVHQPRLDWEDEFTCTVEDVIAHGAEMRSAALRAAIAAENHGYLSREPHIAAEKDKGKRMELIAAGIPLDFFDPGEKQCRFCRAKPTCLALTRKVAEDVFGDFQSLDDANHLVVSTPQTPAGERLGALYGAVGLIRDWCNAIEAECERLVFAGMTVIGPDNVPMKLVEGKKGDRYWKDEGMAEGMLVGVLPPDKVYKPRQIITASAAAKILDKKRTAATWEPFKELIGQEPGKPKIALGSDPRPVYVGEAKTDEFENLDAGDPSR